MSEFFVRKPQNMDGLSLGNEKSASEFENGISIIFSIKVQK